MPLPLAPIAGIALRYGTVALAVWAVARKFEKGRRDQGAEDALDRADEGATIHRGDKDQVNTSFRFRRVVRLGPDGPGFEIDATALTRIRLRRI